MRRRERIDRYHRRPRRSTPIESAKLRHPSHGLRLVPQIDEILDEILDEIDEVLEANAEELDENSGRRGTR